MERLSTSVSRSSSSATTDVSADRNLLCYWQPGSARHNLARELAVSGWHIHATDTPGTTDQLMSEYAIPVGLAFINSDLAAEELDTVRQILTSAGDIAWVVLLNDRRRMNDAVCDLVATYCDDFFTPPYDTKRILEALGHAAGMSSVRRRSHARRDDSQMFYGMVGNSPSMRKLFREIQKVARSDAPVLLIGESGTGKELTARAIHRLSRRSEGPFVVINCAAVPDSLIQSELFGHEKGAFTGADRRHIGHLELAQRGVTFLDEISDMPMEQQVNLLRFLEDKCIERLGGEQHVEVDVRVIVATHDDLDERVHKGTFREDLYYRLNVLRLELPALRDRRGDILPLAQFALEEFSREAGNKRVRGFDQGASEALTRHQWPGNVRELINRVRRALVMTDGRVISAEDLGFAPHDESVQSQTLEAYRDAADRKAILSAMECTRNNLSRSARILGISRTTLYRMIEKFGLTS